LNPAQREELARLQAQIKKLGEVTATILSLAEELKPKTIERQLEKIDSEAGLEFSREVETLESGACWSAHRR